MRVKAIDVPMGGCFVSKHGFVMYRVAPPNDTGKTIFDNDGNILISAITNENPARFFLQADELVDMQEYY